jgi:hypothetical protein
MTGAPGLVTRPRALPLRIAAMFLSPSRELDLIAAEPATPRGLWLQAGLLAAIPPVAELVGRRLFDFGVYARHATGPLGPALVIAVLAWIASLIALGLLARVIAAMAPEHGGRPDRIAALKLALWVSSIGWVTGGLAIFPPLAIVAGFLAILELYPIYVGLPRLMGSAHEKTVAYALAVFGAAMILLFLVRGASTWAQMTVRMFSQT